MTFLLPIFLRLIFFHILSTTCHFSSSTYHIIFIHSRLFHMCSLYCSSLSLLLHIVRIHPPFFHLPSFPPLVRPLSLHPSLNTPPASSSPPAVNREVLICIMRVLTAERRGRGKGEGVTKGDERRGEIRSKNRREEKGKERRTEEGND